MSYIEETLSLNLEDGSVVSIVDLYQAYNLKEKRTFECMNMLQPSGNLLYGYFWSPLCLSELKEKLKAHPDQVDLNLEEVPYSQLVPPTHFKTNDFFSFPHLIVETYGIPSFGEASPTIF